MRFWWGVTAGLALSLMLWTGSALAQGKPSCDAQGRMKTPEKVEGQILKVDNAQGKVTVREADGTVHEFQASGDTLKDLKVGDKLEAKLREAPKCP
jgi:hypothetical protein